MEANDPDIPSPHSSPAVEANLRGRYDEFILTRSPTPSPVQMPDPLPDAQVLEAQRDAARLDLELFSLGPGADTITSHATYNLPACGIVIDNEHHLLLCLTCGAAIATAAMDAHIRAHFGFIDIPDGMILSLVEEFGIVDPSEALVPHNRPAPIFGLRLTEELYSFCERCGRGYGSQLSLRSHQNSRKACPRPEGTPNSYRVGYGQCFTNGPSHRMFQVDPTRLPLRSEIALDPVDVFRATFPPPLDYSTIPFTAPDRDLDLTAFAKREGWITHVQGFTPRDLVDACRVSTDEDGDLHGLKPLVIKYFHDVQPEIAKFSTFGMQRLLADAGM